MELTENQAKQLKCVELEIFKQFIKVCQKLNLKYYLIGGTLLGAVRHKGFIPWDDDIDVAMPRADYEIFIDRAQEFLPAKYFVQSIKSEKNIPYNFCKIRDNDTTYIESSIKKFNLNHGVYIDIFPLDYNPENKRQISSLDLKNKLYTIAIARKFTPTKRSFLKKALIACSRIFLFFYPYRKAVKKREKLYKSVKESNLWANYCGAWGKKEIFPKKWFDDIVQLEFEGLKVNAPKDYDLWLTQVYGDYMQLPPEEKRVGHHYVEICDLDKSYKEYIK